MRVAKLPNMTKPGTCRANAEGVERHSPGVPRQRVPGAWSVASGRSSRASDHASRSVRDAYGFTVGPAKRPCGMQRRQPPGALPRAMSLPPRWGCGTADNLMDIASVVG